MNINKLKYSLLLLAFYSLPVFAMEVETGTYAGNNATDRNISLAGSFTPEFVGVKGVADATFLWWAVSTSGGTAFYNGADNGYADQVGNFAAGTFQVDGAGGGGNETGVTYQYFAFAANGNSDFKSGSFTGNATDDRSITGVGFQPDFVIVKCATGSAAPVFRHKDSSGDTSHFFDATADAANHIQAFEADGFQVGSSANANGSGVTCHYIAMKTGTNIFTQSSYTGNATDDRNISGAGFTPELLWIKDDTTGQIMVESAFEAAAGVTYLWNEGSDIASNAIQALQSDGFQVGTHATVNTNNDVYLWMAFNKTADQPIASAAPPVINRPGVIFFDSDE